MLFTLYIPLTVIIVCLGAVGFIIFRKLSLVANLDIASLPEEREAQKKKEIISRRLNAEEAHLQVRLAFLLKPIKKIWGKLQLQFRIYVGKIERLWHHEQRQVAHVKPEDKEAMREKVHSIVKEAANYFQLSNFPRAEELFISAIKIDPKAAEAYRGLADTYFAQGNTDEAKETYEFLLKLTPDDDAVMVKIAEIAEEKGDVETAINYYQQAVVLNDALSPRFYHLAELLLKVNQPVVAKEAILSAVEIEPKNPKYLDLLIETVLLCGDKALTKKAFEELRAVNPENQKLAVFEEKIGQM